MLNLSGKIEVHTNVIVQNPKDWPAEILVIEAANLDFGVALFPILWALALIFNPLHPNIS